MLYNPTIHNFNHLVKSVAGNAEYLFSNFTNKPNELYVVNYHSTPKLFTVNFIKQLRFFKKHFQIISPGDLDLFYSGNLHFEKPLLLISFDDGLKNNYYAFEILEKENIKSVFFIIPQFVDIEFALQKNYYLKHIRPVINEKIDSREEDFVALNWNEIKKIVAAGHSIGSHTFTHTLIAKESLIENSEREIWESKQVLELRLGIPITSFCSINNTLQSVEKKECELISKNYKYHFTTIPGINHQNSNPLFIKRANIESHWLLGAVKFAIGKWDLKRWNGATQQYLKILE